MQTAAASPYLPQEGAQSLENLAFEWATEAHALSAQLHPVTAQSFAALIRSIDCYFTSQLEGEAVEPLDMVCAMKPGYSSTAGRRDRQLHLRAQMDVQRMIDERDETLLLPTDREFLEWAHQQFYSRLPESSRLMSSTAGLKALVIPGEIRSHTAILSASVPNGDELPLFLARFRQAYHSPELTKPRQLIAVAAAHHRLLWIAPFVAGNALVVRLMTHAMLSKLGVSPSLWSLSRGLMKAVAEYQKRLAAANGPRRNDNDGAGALTLAGLTEFCEFFLTTCLTQVKFMRRLLEPNELQRRIEFYARDEEDARRLPRGSLHLLREALVNGELKRGRSPALVGASERTARRVVSTLVAKGLLLAPTHKSALRLGIPIDVIDRWLPDLFPMEGVFLDQKR